MNKKFILFFLTFFMIFSLAFMPFVPLFAEEINQDQSNSQEQDSSEQTTTDSSNATTSDESASQETNSDESLVLDSEESAVQESETESTTTGDVEETDNEETTTEETTEATIVEEAGDEYQEVEEEILGEETGTAEEESLESDTVASFEKVGQVIEIEGTEVPTTIIITEVQFTKSGALFKDQYTINIYETTELDFSLNWWMAGDMVRVKGQMNESTGLVEAGGIKHLSHGGKYNLGHNGWIEEINTGENYLQVQWMNKLTQVNLIDETRLIIPGKGDVTIDDLEVNDRIRVRGARVGEGEINAKNIIVLRRGEEKFIKLRTKKFLATYQGMVDEDTFTVEGRRKSFSVNLTSDSIVFYQKEKQSDLSKFAVGDPVFLVTRLNDDGTLSAKVVRDFADLSEGGFITGQVGRIDETNSVISLHVGVRKVFRVDISESTSFNDEGGNSLSLADLNRGDRIRVEGTLHESLPLIAASKIIKIDTDKVIKRVKRLPFAK